MASQLGRLMQLLVVLLLGQAFRSCSFSAASVASSRDGSILVRYQPGMRQQARDSLNSRGYDILAEYDAFGIVVAKLRTSAAVAAASAAGGSAITAAAQAAALTSADGIEAAEENAVIRLIEPVPHQLAYNLTGRSWEQEPGAVTAAAGTAAPPCTWPDALNIDYAVGRKTEGKPYGIKMMQVDDPDMQEIADRYKGKVLYCVCDTGIDMSNQEFDGAVISGSGPASILVDNPWNEDTNGHGTHTSGTIAAIRNAKGLVGVSSEGAQLFHFRIMPDGSSSVDAQLEAWTECAAELDRRKAATGTPDMKLIITMSFGATFTSTLVQDAITKMATQRPDILWFAAAGNSGPTGDPEFPAAFPEVIAVAAVDATSTVAPFSTRQDYVALAGPGVNVVSTIPLALTSNEDYYILDVKDRVSTTPPIPEVAADPGFLATPPPEVAQGSPELDVSAPLVDCALATSTCKGATGKICLIKRGGSLFCDKVLKCIAGGGVGALIYNKDEELGCQQLNGFTIKNEDCQAPPGGYVPTMSLARIQGEALQRALQQGTVLTARIRFPKNMPRQTDIGLGLMSGTSMATPAVAGAAGLVWSAHTECSAREIRTALFATAKMPQGATDDGKSYVKGTRNNDVGHGIVQALEAHKYLLAKPCKVPQVVGSLNVTVLVRPDGANGTDANAKVLPPNGSRTVGQYVTLIVIVRDAAGKKVVGQNVKITIAPSNKLLRCGTYERTTNTAGALGIRCKVLRAGRAVVIATVPAGPGMAASRGQSTLTIRRA